MKRLVLTLFANLAVFFLPRFAHSQCSVTSTDGYTVHISVQPTGIIITNNGCPNGFNYNVQLSYSISFSGSNIPSNLYDLQGSFSCNSQSQGFALPRSAGSGVVTTWDNNWVGNCNPPFPPTVTSMACSSVTLYLSGPGINSTSCSVLPIELQYFNVSVIDHKVHLTWSTSTEKDNEYFLVEKSKDGKNFVTVDRIDGAGDSSVELSYHTTDYTPFTGVSYYRLKQVDYDRNYSYSEIRRVEIANPTTKIIVHPNPNKSQELELVASDLYNFIKMDVISTTGLTIFSTELTSTKISLPNIPRGIYYLRLVDGSTRKVETLKYVQE